MDIDIRVGGTGARINAMLTVSDGKGMPERIVTVRAEAEAGTAKRISAGGAEIVGAMINVAPIIN